MRRVFKTRMFNRWMWKTLLVDQALLRVVDEMESGLIDADLGGSVPEDKVYKKRVPLPGRGKSGSTRTIVATCNAGKWFFLYGFEKTQKDNIPGNELMKLRVVARFLLSASDMEIGEALASGELQEVFNE